MMSKRQLIFIDESGDPGLTAATKSQFIIAAVVIIDESESALIRAKIIEYRRSLGWHDGREFKFNKVKKIIARGLLEVLKPYNFQIQAVIFDKNSAAKSLRINNRYSLYNYVLIELLKHINFTNAKICIDGNVGDKYRKKVTTLLRQNLPKSQKIASLRFADSHKVDELQFADIIAGAINRSVSSRGKNEKWLDLLREKTVEIRQL